MYIYAYIYKIYVYILIYTYIAHVPDTLLTILHLLSHLIFTRNFAKLVLLSSLS